MKKAWRWQPEAVLVGMAVAYILVGFAVHGCGGNPLQQLQQRLADQVAQAATQAFGRVLNRAFGAQGGRGFVSRLRRLTRQASTTCPTTTTNWTDFTQPPPNPLVITVDYGNGCTDAEGDSGKGSYTMTISSPQFDDQKNLVGGTISFRFNDFTLDGETLSGTFTVEFVNATTANVQQKLAYQSAGCTEGSAFEGTITFAPDHSSFSVTGNGTYTNSKILKQLNYSMNNVRFVEDCDFPVGGTMTVTYDSTKEVWDFSSTCGSANVSVNGGEPQTVDLKTMQPCD